MSEPYVKIGPAGTIEICIVDAAGRDKSMPITPAVAARVARELLIAATAQSSNARPAVGAIVGDGYPYVKSWQVHVAAHGHEGITLNVAPGVPMRFLMESDKLRSLATALLA